MYDRVLIERVRAETEYAIWKEQCGFRQGKGGMEQMIAVRQKFQKYLGNMKYVF